MDTRMNQHQKNLYGGSFITRMAWHLGFSDYLANRPRRVYLEEKQALAYESGWLAARYRTVLDYIRDRHLRTVLDYIRDRHLDEQEYGREPGP